MSTPTNLISISEFKDMRASYDSSVRVGDQTTSVWFSLDNLKEYLAFVESEAKAKNIPVSGIRFHFIAKTDADKKMNLALAPTYSKGGKEISFDPMYSSDNAPKSLKTLIANPPHSTNSSILNYGTMCPPFCGEL